MTLHVNSITNLDGVKYLELIEKNNSLWANVTKKNLGAKVEKGQYFKGSKCH